MAGSRSGGKVTADGADDGVAEGDAVTLGEGGGIFGGSVDVAQAAQFRVNRTQQPRFNP